jgi:hypothetical protein
MTISKKLFQRSLFIIAFFAFFNFTVKAQGQNAAFPLSVSENDRYLVDKSGDTFIWIGDTAWELFHRLNRDEAEFYLENRKAKGFTIIQAVILAELDGLRTPNPYGDIPFIDMDPTQPNDAYFQHVDHIVSKADSLGLIMGLLPTWGDKLPSENPGAGPIIFNPDNAYQYGLFLGQRYKDDPVVWILGGDRAIQNQEVFETWNQMARGIEEGSDRTQLITYHPRGTTHSAWWFHNEEWLDFNMYQSGHVSMNPVYEYAEYNYTLRPTKPFVEGEPAYEQIPIRFWEYMDFSQPGRQRVPDGVLGEDGTISNLDHFSEGFISDYDVRVHAYWNFLSGAAGYTYGNNAIWQMYSEDQEIAIPTLNTWREAMEAPGAFQVGLLGSLLKERPLKKLRPDQSMIYGENREGDNYITAASATDGSYGYVYLAKGQDVNLVLDQFSSEKVNLTWFNPEDGTTIDAGEALRKTILCLTPPIKESGDPDWLLILDAID